MREEIKQIVDAIKLHDSRKLKHLLERGVFHPMEKIDDYGNNVTFSILYNFEDSPLGYYLQRFRVCQNADWMARRVSCSRKKQLAIFRFTSSCRGRMPGNSTTYY